MTPLFQKSPLQPTAMVALCHTEDFWDVEVPVGLLRCGIAPPIPVGFSVEQDIGEFKAQWVHVHPISATLKMDQGKGLCMFSLSQWETLQRDGQIIVVTHSEDAIWTYHLRLGW